MDLENYEHSIKKRLEKRIVAPSDGAWDQLESMLEAEEKTSKKYFWWMAIAATFLLGFFMVKSLMHNNTGEIKGASLVFISKNSCNSSESYNGNSFLSNHKEETEAKLSLAEKNMNNKTDLKTHSDRFNYEPGRVKEMQGSNELSTTNGGLIMHKEMNLIRVENKKSIHKDPEIDKLLVNRHRINENEEAALLLHKSKLELEAQIRLKNSNNSVNSAQLLNEVENKIQTGQGTDESIHERVIHFVKNKLEEKVNSVFVKR